VNEAIEALTQLLEKKREFYLFHLSLLANKKDMLIYDVYYSQLPVLKAEIEELELAISLLEVIH